MLSDFEIQFKIHTVISLGGNPKNYSLFIGLLNLLKSKKFQQKRKKEKRNERKKTALDQSRFQSKKSY